MKSAAKAKSTVVESFCIEQVISFVGMQGINQGMTIQCDIIKLTKIPQQPINEYHKKDFADFDIEKFKSQVREAFEGKQRQ